MLVPKDHNRWTVSKYLVSAVTVQEFTATEENYYAGAINWNLLFSPELDTAVLDREQARVYSLVYRPLFRDKIGAFNGAFSLENANKLHSH